jgi:hypothetical protein
MDTTNPARQMALIRKTRFCGNLGKAEFPVSNHFDRPSQSQLNDVAMRAHTDGSGEGAGKMELAAVRHSRKRRDVKWFIQMFEDKLLQSLEDVSGQQTVRFRPGPHRVTCSKDVEVFVRTEALERTHLGEVGTRNGRKIVCALRAVRINCRASTAALGQRAVVFDSCHSDLFCKRTVS